MTTPAPVPWQVSHDASAASALVTELETLLTNATPIVWHDVLATALALKAILVRDPDAEQLCTHIVVNVISKCYKELGCPDEAVIALEEALSRRPEVPTAVHRCPRANQEQVFHAEIQQQMEMRQLLHRCYQECLDQAFAASSNIRETLPQQQQQKQASAIVNNQQLLHLATLLQDIKQLATTSADLAELYSASDDSAAAAHHYAQCLSFCSTAAATAGQHDLSSSSWLHELLLRTVSAAVDVNISQGSAAGAGWCISSYLAIQQHRGRSSCDECAVCYEAMNGQAPVLLMTCGHMFHRQCCNEWFGTKMYECGRFIPECPICRQVDASLQPSQAALEALQEMQQHCAQQEQQHSDDSSSSSSGDESDTDSAGSTDSGINHEMAS